MTNQASRGRARLRPDDDIYQADRSWLGPAPYTLPFAIPYRSVPVAMAVFFPGLVVLRLFGLSGLSLYAGDALTACVIAALAARLTGPERPVTAMIIIAWHEISAPRPPRRPPQPETETLRPGLVPVRPLTGQPPGTRPRRTWRRR